MHKHRGHGEHCTATPNTILTQLTREIKMWENVSEMLAVTILVSRLQVEPVLPWLHESQWREQLKHKGLTLGEREGLWAPAPPRDHEQDHHSTAGQGRSLGNHTRRRQSMWGQVSVVTWDDSQPARLAGVSYIIGDFTDILSSIVLRHVGECEHLHVRAVNAWTLQSTHTRT